MSTNLIAELTSGPSEMDLMKCLFRGPNSPRPGVLMSQAVTFGGADGTHYNIIIDSLQRESGSGKSWNFAGHLVGLQGNPCKWGRVKGYFETQTRKGNLFDDLEAEETEEDPTTLLEQAFAKNPDVIRQMWRLIDGFVNLTTIDQGHYAVGGYEALDVIEPLLRAAKTWIVPEVKRPAQFVEKECSGCHSMFGTNNDSDKCYNCTLIEITNGMAPEEGDFNTAKILSGTMTPQERRWLQEDLEQVERGISGFEPEDLDEQDEDDWDEWEEEEDDRWDFDENQDAKNGHEG